jgi:hypothetical protein
MLAVSLAAALSCAAGATAETRKVTAGAHYAAGGLHRFFWGDDYRDMWTLPVSIEVLDLRTFGGGLSPVRRVGGQQTKGLALAGGDGRSWTFRSLDKDPVAILPADLQQSLAARIVRDQVAASHPAAPVVADVLLRAAGVLHAEHRLVVMPDDPALGEFREVFAGLVGTIEEYPAPVPPGRTGFQGAHAVVDHLELFRRLDESPAERVDARALLRARLVDLLMGDWDRHRAQWRWAKLPDSPLWQPIPEDRDQAFCRFEGAVLAVARQRQPRFVSFGPDFPGVDGLTFNGSEQDRWLLTELSRAAWEEVAADLKARLDDSVLDAAAAQLPAEYRERDGARLLAGLRGRRDALPAQAERFYRHLSRQVDVRLTDAAEWVSAEHRGDGSLELRAARRLEDAPSSEPFFQRVFRADETQEVRVYLRGGDDRLATSGSPRIRLRVIAGPGYKTLDDSRGGGTRFSVTGPARIERGPGTRVDDREHVPPPPNPRAPWIPPRDWGGQRLVDPVLGYATDVGVYLGAGMSWERYGFRKHPWASRQTLDAAFAFGAERPRFRYDGAFRRENSSTLLQLRARASGLEVLRFYGFGNETDDDAPDEFFRLRQTQYRLEPALDVGLGRRLRLSAGPVLRYATTDLAADRFIGRERPYGSQDFGQLGAALGLLLDTRDSLAAPNRGVRIAADAELYPSVWSVEETFGAVEGTAAAYLGAPEAPLEPVLALRAGARRVFGQYPFHESAFLGGAMNLRGLRPQRYAGDASLFGSAELRLRLARVHVLLPAELGVHGLADTGRVFLDGESSDQWHTGAGGGLWLSFLERSAVFSLSVARSEGRTGVYVNSGFGF